MVRLVTSFNAARALPRRIERHVLHDPERALIDGDVLVERLEEVILGLG